MQIYKYRTTTISHIIVKHFDKTSRRFWGIVLNDLWQIAQ